MNDDVNETIKNLQGVGSEFVTLGKDLVALFRDSSLFVVALLLFFFPAKLNTVLTEAGFEEGSLIGLKWKAKLVDSDAALKEARATIIDLKTQLDKTSQALVDAQAKLNDPSLKERLGRLEAENKQLDAASAKVADSVTSAIYQNAAVIEKALSSVSSNTNWGVIYGGDTALDKARYEKDVIAPKLGIHDVTIFFRQGYYRSVSVVGSRPQAEQALSKAKLRRADAYIVDMSKWCPNSAEKNGYRECTAP
jgi:hypothetical protein